MYAQVYQERLRSRVIATLKLGMQRTRDNLEVCTDIHLHHLGRRGFDSLKLHLKQMTRPHHKAERSSTFDQMSGRLLPLEVTLGQSVPVQRRLMDGDIEALASYESPEWKVNKATKRYQSNQKYKVINTLVWYTGIQAKKLDNIRRASQFRFATSLNKVMRSLQLYCQQCQDKQRNNALAHLYRQGKLKRHYYRAIQNAYLAVQNRHVGFKTHTDQKLMKLCLIELVRYKIKRQEVNQNKALAYLKWRAKTLRRILMGPKEKGSSCAIGLLEYCKRRAV